MTYIELINQFWQIRRETRITSYEADFYFYLLNEANRRLWRNPIEISTTLISAELGISRKTIADVRNKLKQKGFIDFENGEKRKCSASYTLLYVTIGNKKGNIKGNINGNIEGNINGNPLYKTKKKTKKEEDTNVSKKDDKSPSLKSETYSKFLVFVEEKAPYCHKHMKPITEKELDKLKEKYSATQIADTILDIENRQDLRKRYTSLYRTTLKWLKNAS